MSHNQGVELPPNHSAATPSDAWRCRHWVRSGGEEENREGSALCTQSASFRIESKRAGVSYRWPPRIRFFRTRTRFIRTRTRGATDAKRGCFRHQCASVCRETRRRPRELPRLKWVLNVQATHTCPPQPHVIFAKMAAKPQGGFPLKFGGR